jgi:arylsulfatase A-like enzyme
MGSQTFYRLAIMKFMTMKLTTVKNLLRFCLLLFVTCSGFLLTNEVFAKEQPPTNVVLIMTDNQGAWTLGCYGNKDIPTPNIDQLASNGIRFTRAFSSNPVCSPARATYLTGLLPSQHAVHCYLRRNEAQMGPNPYCMIGEFKTLPKVLSEAGYQCGLVGKWHLGGNMTPQEGFKYWITMPVGHTSTFYDAEIIENGKLRKEPKYMTDLWTEHGVKFIKQNKSRPFFLFLSYNGPYGLSPLLLRPARNRHHSFFADKQLPSFTRAKMHPWLHNNKKYLNNIVSIRRYGAEVAAVDDGVGKIMKTLKQQGLSDNTLVVFCADQGWMGGQNGIWGMGDHTRPLTAFDEMMHVPMIFYHKGKIISGNVSDLMVSNYDLMTTVLNHLGLATPERLNPNSPGKDFSPVFKKKSIPWKNQVFYEAENLRCIRTEEWKYIHRYPDGPNELYHLKNDPWEKINLYGQPLTVEIQGDLKKRLFEYYDRYADPQYDLWNGGRSKPKLVINGKYRLTGE